MVERSLGRKSAVNMFGVVGEVIGWFLDPVLDGGVARTFGVYENRRNKLALYFPIPLSMMTACGL